MFQRNEIQKSCLFLDLTEIDNHYTFSTAFTNALAEAEAELQVLNETIDSIVGIRPECDKLDYILAASSGALCGIIDIFLIKKPGESPIGNITDKWFTNRIEDFAKLCGWADEKHGSPVAFLEKKFKIPYDQRGTGDAGRSIFKLTPSNHHFKSLAHNPTLCGLFFSILDQFSNTSHFISNGQMIALMQADDSFTLQGHDVPSNFFCAFINWFGHLVSDVSGSSGSKGRGMGLPSPFWAWTNDLIAIKSKLGLTDSEFITNIQNLALEIYKRGFDVRFQTAQTIPILINELLVRVIYAVRRLMQYYSDTKENTCSFKVMWKKCEPFKNPSVKRMLTVAHGVFCLLDLGDATIRSFVAGKGAFNPVEFFLRLNLPGIGRFTVSLYGETKRILYNRQAEADAQFAQKEKVIVTDYIANLKLLAVKDKDFPQFTFIDDFQNCGVSNFKKTVQQAELLNVSPEKILHNKKEIDHYFGRRFWKNAKRS